MKKLFKTISLLTFLVALLLNISLMLNPQDSYAEEGAPAACADDMVEGIEKEGDSCYYDGDWIGNITKCTIVTGHGMCQDDIVYGGSYLTCNYPCTTDPDP